MMKQNFLIFLCLLGVFHSFGQEIHQTIRGSVVDEDTRQPLIGATILVLDSSPVIGDNSDKNGLFRLTDVPIGRASLRISYIGYKEKVIPNIEVNSAKEVVLEIALSEAVVQAEGVVITAAENKGDAINEMALVSVRSISSEQTSRFAGGFNDPSKISSNFAGVTHTQDGGNDIIVRGNSPKYVQWRLEGAQITNPNHFGDQNAVSGIVGALNNNLLSTSDFYTGAFPAEFGDALSGVYDVRMRKGNNEKFEGIFGLGLLGTDITLEGPFKKGYRGSFLVNYRYSTLGLASELGIVNLDVNLKFQDAAYKLWLPTKKLGTFSLFGLGGKSGFLFEDVDPSVWVTPGDDFAQTDQTSKDYQKRAHLLNTGLNHTILLGQKSYLKTTLLYSNEGIADEVYQNTLDADSVISRRLDFLTDLKKGTYRLNSTLNTKLNPRHKVGLGVRYALFDQDMEQSLLDAEGKRHSLIDFDEKISLLRSFINWKFTPIECFTLVAGLHNTNVLFNNKHSLEPRLALSYALGEATKFSLGYGNHSTMENVHNYFAQVERPDGSVELPNLDLGLLKANHFVLGVDHYFGKNLHMKLEAYYQDLYQVPVENSDTSSYSTLNEGLELNYVDLVNEGKGRNYGVELTVERFLDRGFYFLFNASLYESTYTALDGVKRNTQFNGNYLVNILGGKEFSGLGKKDNQTFAVNLKLFMGGGRYIVPLLRDQSGVLAVNPAKGLVYDYSEAYLHKLDDLINGIVSFSYKWNARRTTHELYLNIDNVSNNQARLNEYYDTSAPNGIGYERQTGMIPNFLYRIYF